MKLLTSLLILIQFTIYSQSLTIEGIVVDEFDMPLSGTNIYSVEENYGTITNKKGMFKIIVKNDKSIFKVSYLGYKEEIMDFKKLKKNNVKIVLKTFENTLEDVVISSIPIPDLLKNIVKESKKRIKKSVILTTYNREILKTDSAYSYFADGISIYNLKGNRKKIKAKLYHKESRLIKGNESTDYYKLMKSNPFGYNIKKEVKKAFKNNMLLKSIYKYSEDYDFTLKTKIYNDSLTLNTVEFTPLNKKGFTFKGYVTYDTKTNLILEYYIKKASNKIEDNTGIESKLLTFNIYDIEQKVSFRIEKGNYILVYKKDYQNVYIGNILGKKFNTKYSFYSDLFVLKYEEKEFNIKNQENFKYENLLSYGNDYKDAFWNNNSIVKSEEEQKFINSIKN